MSPSQPRRALSFAFTAVVASAVSLLASATGAEAARAHSCLSGMLQVDAASVPLPAPLGRDALGFELGAATRAEVQDWAATADIACEPGIQKLHCTEVPVPGIADARYDEVLFRFDNRGRVIQVEADRNVHAVAAAARHLTESRERLARQVGAITSTNDAGVGLLSQRYGRVAQSHRYHGYAAELTATNFCARGIVIQERFRLVGDDRA